ncbi:MAG: manganese efflux pump MntP family protein [Erysipelotrichaceae bacterium]|nr:manganese efflux pump MntP family protein [Erysipelotrichaceae bacterium]
MLLLINAVLLGVGLAMDAFSVSLANGLNEPDMKKSKLSGIAGIFALFQFAMPLIGWFCVHSLLEKFKAFEKFIPWIALILLLYIGGKMLIEGIKGNDEEETPALTFTDLMVQGVATSIDALSVGFTIAELNLGLALVESVIIGLVTFVICAIGLLIGKKAGSKLSNKASILGGVILIAIGIEIFIKGVF